MPHVSDSSTPSTNERDAPSTRVIFFDAIFRRRDARARTCDDASIDIDLGIGIDLGS
jgi:hypothetical protein|tara:strand:- start:725 stop:895 length:171 start_codon:yes stop_codon:yes gene_type:complete